MTAEALSLEVLAARDGDRQAFARLVDATRNVVCSVTLAIVRDVEASEDLAQDVFVAAWTGLPTLRAPDSFLPWLRQLARNRAHEHLRGRVRRRQRLASWEPAAEASPDRAPLASERLITEEERQALALAMDALPEEAREVVTLYYREGSSVLQVARLLDLSEDAVKKRLERARTALREAVLTRFADSVRTTTPGAAFTLAVAAGLAAAAPGTASAAAVVGGAGANGKLLALLAGLGGTLAGLAGGLAGIWLGLRLEERKALDQRERRELRSLGVRASLLTVLAMAGMFAAPRLAAWGYAPVGAMIFGAAYLVFAVGLALLYGRVLPRILARRHAAELIRDPAAALRQRRQARFRLTGLVLGLTCGLAGAAMGTWFLLHP
jgi:RNA polymerase sigma factor (sigma-70 family)